MCWGVGQIKLSVIGIAENTPSENLAIFSGSLRNAAPSADAIIFVNAPVPKQHIDIANRWQITLVEYNSATFEPSFLRSYHPSTIRWILFQHVLNNSTLLSNSYEKVLFADVRDTVFQSDPFPLMQSTSGEFKVFAENLGQSIASCGWNSGWIRDCFGEKIATLIGANEIICSGISMATMDKAQEYLTVMSRIMTGQSMLGQRFPKCERNGVDQGVHNVVVHMALVNSITIHHETDFPITHLQATSSIDPAFINDPFAIELTFGVETPLVLSVVHQYDRFAMVQLALATRYVYWEDYSKPISIWRSREDCAKFSTIEGTDILAGFCDSGSQRVSTPGSCCEICHKKGDGACSAFAYSDGICYFKNCQLEVIKERVSILNPSLISNIDWSGPDANLSKTGAVGVMSAYLKAVLDP